MDRFKKRDQQGDQADDVDELPFDELDATEDLRPVAGSATGTLGYAAAGSPGSVGGDSSIISESAPSDVPSDFTDTRLQGDAPHDTRGSGLPLIGHLATGDQQRVLGGALFVGLIGLLAVSISSYNAADRSASQVAAAGDALMQSQRLAKSATQALVGSSASFAEVKESVGALSASVHGLQEGSDTIARAAARCSRRSSRSASWSRRPRRTPASCWPSSSS